MTMENWNWINVFDVKKTTWLTLFAVNLKGVEWNYWSEYIRNKVEIVEIGGLFSFFVELRLDFEVFWTFGWIVSRWFWVFWKKLCVVATFPLFLPRILTLKTNFRIIIFIRLCQNHKHVKRTSICSQMSLKLICLTK